MEYLLDSNAYRELATNRSREEIDRICQTMRVFESNNGVQSGFSILVAMELIRHLKAEDPACTSCYDSLYLMYKHCSRIAIEQGEEHHKGILYPPMDVVIIHYLFNKTTDLLDVYGQVINLTQGLVQDYDPTNIHKYKTEINTIGQQLVFEKGQIKQNCETLIAQMNNGEADWTYFKDNKSPRKKWFNELGVGKLTFLVGYGIFKRAHLLTENHLNKSETEFNIFLAFFERFYPAIKMFDMILSRIGNSVQAMSNITDKRWNTIIDMSILFGALHRQEDITLVTSDKDMKQYFELSSKSTAMDLATYLNHIDLKL